MNISKPTFSSSSAVVSSWCVTSITGWLALALVVPLPLEAALEVDVEVEVEGGPSSLPITDTLVCHSSNDFNCLNILKIQNSQTDKHQDREKGSETQESGGGLCFKGEKGEAGRQI
jgi:hypothetical protein